MKMLRVRAVGDILCPRFDIENDRRFVGRTKGPATPEGTPWIPTADPVEVPNLPEFRLALRHGDIEAADEATALEAGMVWTAPKGAD